MTILKTKSGTYQDDAYDSVYKFSEHHQAWLFECKKNGRSLKTAVREIEELELYNLNMMVSDAQNEF